MCVWPWHVQMYDDSKDVVGAFGPSDFEPLSMEG